MSTAAEAEGDVGDSAKCQGPRGSGARGVAGAAVPDDANDLEVDGVFTPTLG